MIEAENRRALSAFLCVLLCAVLVALAGCGRFAPAIANPLSDNSHWAWDCPGNPLGNPPGCFEVSPCGERIEHPLEMCCLEGDGSAGAYWPPSSAGHSSCHENLSEKGGPGVSASR